MASPFLREKWPRLAILVAGLTALCVAAFLLYLGSTGDEQPFEDLNQTEVRIGNIPSAPIEIYQAGKSLDEARLVSADPGVDILLSPGNYFLKTGPSPVLYFPIPLIGFRSGPDGDGSFIVTVRTPSVVGPPRLLSHLPPWAFVPGGTFLLGDRQNPREQHHVWLTGFFIAPCEVTNEEFRVFVQAEDGYPNDENWTEAGRTWKRENKSNVSALLSPEDSGYRKFGQGDQPVTWVNWFEATAFCRWLTVEKGEGKWWFALPNEAEWEKAARGPDNLDFALSMFISDNEAPLYNWKKNPIAEITVIGVEPTLRMFKPNRYGLYHMTGNVVEWTISIFKPFSRKEPFRDDARNRDDTRGLRVARGGSWYSASIAYISIPYRDAVPTRA